MKIEGLHVRASLEALYCVLKQGTLSSALLKVQHRKTCLNMTVDICCIYHCGHNTTAIWGLSPTPV